jgi:putative salt-induced outer membrane protein YdiY
MHRFNARRTRPIARTWVYAPILIAMTLVAFVSQAAEPPPALVVLSSGNQMTGEVRELSRGRLNFRVAGAGSNAIASINGSIDIEWANVATLRTSQLLDIELNNGTLMTGSIETTAPGLLEIATSAGPVRVNMPDIVRIQRHQETFGGRVSGNIDLGFDFLTANDEIDWTLNASARHRTPRYDTEVSVSSLIRRQDSDTSQQRNHLEVESRRLLEKRWFAAGLFEAEDDAELDLDLRILLGAAAGRTLIQTKQTSLAVYGGIDVSHEEFSGSSDDDDNVFEVLGAMQWDWFEPGGNLEALLEATTYVSPEDGRIRLQVEGSLRHDLARDFYLSFNVYENYNSDPPEGSEKSDLGVSITIGRSF